MNIYTLLEGKLDEIALIQSLFKNNDYIGIYEKYSDVLERFLFVESLDEFNDFIEEQGDIQPETFLLELASNLNMCCSIGMYESNAPDLVLDYLKSTTQINADKYECDDVHEFLMSTLGEINRAICPEGMQYILLFDDTYCEGVFYIFYVSEKEALEEWLDTNIKRLI